MTVSLVAGSCGPLGVCIASEVVDGITSTVAPMSTKYCRPLFSSCKKNNVEIDEDVLATSFADECMKQQG